VYDQTKEPRQGVKKNELGRISANIYTATSPRDILFQAMEIELAAIGAQIKDSNITMEKDTTNGVQISATLLDYFVEPEVELFMARICAVVTVEIVIEFSNGKKYRNLWKGVNGIYTPMFWYTSIPMEGERIYQAALEGAMKDFLIQAIPGICELISKKR